MTLQLLQYFRWGIPSIFTTMESKLSPSMNICQKRSRIRLPPYKEEVRMCLWLAYFILSISLQFISFYLDDRVIGKQGNLGRN